ncbi:hypothetical protein [Brevundimonas sp.]|uniref:hypothetical protein n=1 Tax=Brevundimonas sp. TaxID=1871086 RepID=UPI002D3B4887|nr:hypothetical protein [Brevundimonas sp.]HYD29205.1 hypothetical protein [Brevundimonas sp.]
MPDGNATGNAATARRYRPVTAGREAVSAEALVGWTYHRQRAHLAGVGVADRVLLRGGGSTATAAVGRNGRLGCSIDTSGFAALAVADPGVHPDAEAVHALISAAGGIGAALLVLHGKGLSRPDWMPTARPRAAAVLNARGRPKMHFGATGKAEWCHVEYLDPPALVEAARFEWLEWAAALARLAVRLRAEPGMLRAHRVTAALPPATPWERLGQAIDGAPLAGAGRG